MSWPAVCARRLERHALAAPASGAGPAEIAGMICGAHTQVLTAAELCIGLRGEGLGRAAIQEALWVEHSLIKSFGPRGTVHLLPAADMALWTGALSALPAGPVALPAGVALTPAQTDELVAAIGEALAAAELTVDELTEALAARCGPWASEKVMPAFQELWPRWRLVTATAAQRGALCFGPNRGRKITYTSPRRWLPGLTPMEGQAALGELLRRYLHAYGPATPQQFAQWLSAPRRWASELFAANAAALQQVTLEGEPAWVVAGDTAMPEPLPGHLRLLPYFDAYGVGCHPRPLLFPGRAAERALGGGQAGAFPLLLIGGVVAGVWHQRRAGRRIAFTVEPLGELSAAQRRALDEQVELVAAFLDGAPELTVGPISVGAHA